MTNDEEQKPVEAEVPATPEGESAPAADAPATDAPAEAAAAGEEKQPE